MRRRAAERTGDRSGGVRAAVGGCRFGGRSRACSACGSARGARWDSSLLAVAASALVLWPRRRMSAPMPDRGVTVLAVNLWYLNRRMADAARDIVAAGPDVVVVSELSETAHEVLAASFEHHLELSFDGARGHGVYSRLPLERLPDPTQIGPLLHLRVGGAINRSRCWQRTCRGRCCSRNRVTAPRRSTTSSVSLRLLLRVGVGARRHGHRRRSEPVRPSGGLPPSGRRPARCDARGEGSGPGDVLRESEVAPAVVPHRPHRGADGVGCARRPPREDQRVGPPGDLRRGRAGRECGESTSQEG